MVFHFAKSDVQERLTIATDLDVVDATSFKNAIGKLFEHFIAKNARACAISLPPGFAPTKVTADEAEKSIDELRSRNLDAGDDAKRTASNFAFWTLADFCAQHQLTSREHTAWLFLGFRFVKTDHQIRS